MRSKSARRSREHPADPQAERVRLGEPGPAHEGELTQVDRVSELVGPRHPERVRRPVEVEARHLHQLAHVVELGIGLAGEHRDVVAEVGDLACEVPGVDALTAAVRVAPVDQPRDAQPLGVGCGRGWARRQGVRAT